MLETTIPEMNPYSNIYPGQNYTMIRGMNETMAQKISPFTTSINGPPPRGLEKILNP